MSRGQKLEAVEPPIKLGERKLSTGPLTSGRVGRTERFDRVHICQETCISHVDSRWGACRRCGAPPPRRGAGATP